MKSLSMPPCSPLLRHVTLLAAFASPLPALAQAACSSDGQRAPVALMERFISADCATCWAAADTPRPPQAAVALDWIVPGTQGEDAPLSAAATRDAAVRLQALGLPQTQSTSTRITRTTRAGPVGTLRLRVAQGPALNGYLGVSIALRPASRLKKPVIAWLALVETIPAGVEGSPVERNLVRNVLSPAWSGPEALSKSQGMHRVETRVMGIPAGANPQRLRVVGWVEDMQGRIRVIAQSHCAPSP